MCVVLFLVSKENRPLGRLLVLHRDRWTSSGKEYGKRMRVEMGHLKKTAIDKRKRDIMQLSDRIMETTDAERVKRPKLPKKRVLRLQRRKKK